MLPNEINILIGCEESQAVTIELRKRGFNALSLDVKDCSGGHPEWHIKSSLTEEIINSGYWHAGIFFTPCTFSCNSSNKHLYNNDGSKDTERWANLEIYAGMLRDCLNSKIPHVGCENPIPHRHAIKIIGRKYDQLIHPYMFGDGEQKSTCLWLKNMPKLLHYKYDDLFNKKTWVDGREQKIWKLPPDKPGQEGNRSTLRSKTYKGIAHAMAEQWGSFLIENIK